jgi:hypothetical protein
VQGDVEAAARDPEDLSKIVDEGDYTKQWIFEVDRIVRYWKKILSMAFIIIKNSMPGFKASKNSLTLLLGTNAAGT